MTHNRGRRHLMQRRAAYAEFEKTILDLYDRRSLTLHQLDQIANQYRWLPVGSTGGSSRIARDGKDLSQVCIELVDPAFPLAATGSHGDHEDYWKQEINKWEDIIRWRWNWHAYDVPSFNPHHQEKVA